MSVSATFGSQIIAVPNSSFKTSFNGATRAAPVGTNGGSWSVIECSSRPQKKATAHHMKTRPRKTQPWDIRRKPTVYPPLPPLPPDWTPVAEGGDHASATEVCTPPLEAPVPSG